MDGIRSYLESALRELHDQDQLCGRGAARVRHILTTALRVPSKEMARRAVVEIECCYQSQGSGIGLDSLRRLDETLAGSPVD